jgi:hypothetical protein
LFTTEGYYIEIDWWMLELLKFIGLLPFLSGTLDISETLILLLGFEYLEGVLLLAVSSTI